MEAISTKEWSKCTIPEEVIFVGFTGKKEDRLKGLLLSSPIGRGKNVSNEILLPLGEGARRADEGKEQTSFKTKLCLR